MAGRLTVSLAALRDNYRTLTAACGKPVAPVVKADGYGLGAGMVTGALLECGAKEVFVATAEEAARLRTSFRDLPIYVFEGATNANIAVLLETNARPVLNSLIQVSLWCSTGRVAGLHIDTGMHRLGLALEEVAVALQQVDFPLEILISHFACADEPDASANADQIARFQRVRDEVQALHEGVRCSLSNSAGALRQQVPEDFVRGGIALYGGNPFTHLANSLEPTVRLEGEILQIRQVRRGESVGYGATFTAPRDMRVATVGVGYADGVVRLLSNRGSAWAQGRRLPFVGRVSMDLTHVDVSDVEALVVGDYVEFLGANVPVDEVAELAETIAYEILTGLDPRDRLSRQYTQEPLA